MLQTALQIRWLLLRDMPAVLAIEAEAFRYPWVEDDFVRCLRQRNSIGMVAEHDNLIAGYMIYAFERTTIRIHNFAVDRAYRREGVGRQMAEKLQAKLASQRRRRITVDVADYNLDAHLFFRAMGFRAVGIDYGHFKKPAIDSYRFMFQHQGKEDERKEYRRDLGHR